MLGTGKNLLSRIAHVVFQATVIRYGHSLTRDDLCRNSLVPILPAGHRAISLNGYTAQFEPLPYGIGGGVVKLRNRGSDTLLAVAVYEAEQQPLRI
jgi:hypothetical protein